MTTKNNTAQANKRLSVFLGTWHTSGDLYDDDGAVAGKIDAVDRYEWLPGNYALIHYADSRMGEEKIHGVEIIGYDPVREHYFGPFFDDHGSVGAEQIRNDGDTWIWQGENVMGVKHHRCTAVFQDKDTIAGHHECSDDGEHWRAWMDITLRRMA